MGWAVNWDKPEERQEWYHNMSSIMQAGPCVRSNQLDYDEDVMHKVGDPLSETSPIAHTQSVMSVSVRLCSERSSYPEALCSDNLFDLSARPLHHEPGLLGLV